MKAYAKINLSLDILGVRDGYHLIDSVASTIDVADVIALKKRKKDKLVSVSMHGLGSESISFNDNNAVKAAERFIRRFDTCGVDITVYKNIPMGAGLGGSSADAAGVLNGMKKLFKIEDGPAIKEIADSIGSDCGYMLYGGYARLKGRGEEISLIDCPLKLDIILLIPPSPVSTAKCYALSDKISCGCASSSVFVQKAIVAGDKQSLGGALSNGLLPAACAINPDVGEAVAQLKQFAPLGVNMTGSGSCVYALFENGEFCRYAISRYKGKYKMIQTKTYLPKREKENG